MHDAGLALLYQFRLEAALSVGRDCQRQLSILPLQRLARRAVAAVRLKKQTNRQHRLQHRVAVD